MRVNRCTLFPQHTQCGSSATSSWRALLKVLLGLLRWLNTWQVSRLACKRQSLSKLTFFVNEKNLTKCEGWDWAEVHGCSAETQEGRLRAKRRDSKTRESLHQAQETREEKSMAKTQKFKAQNMREKDAERKISKWFCVKLALEDCHSCVFVFVFWDWQWEEAEGLRCEAWDFEEILKM